MSVLKENFKDDAFVGNRKYQLVNNADGTVSLVDVTTYTQVGDFFDSATLNGITIEINLKDKIQKATGTATAITLTNVDLSDGKAKSFIAYLNNSAAATTINGKPLYKQGTTAAPTLIANKAYTIWYSTTNTCFYLMNEVPLTADVVSDVGYTNLGTAGGNSQKTINAAIDTAIGAKGVSPGTVVDMAYANVPSGYLAANGQAVSRTTYAALFALLGTYYGVGDGSTTFNLPDYRARTTVGLHSSYVETNTLGKTGGEFSHTLTPSEAPQHSHSNMYWPDGNLVSLAGASPTGYALSWTLGNVSLGTGAATIQTDVKGGGATHNNMQPYAVTSKVIKY
jgi:Microcystin-dependent protein